MNEKKRTGARQWTKKSYNIQKGCEHNCRYCWAASNAHRRGYKKRDVWHKVDRCKKLPNMPSNTTVMFPSTHDITPFNINEYIPALRLLIERGNKVLVVSKPHWACISAICAVMGAFKKDFMFRFSIGSDRQEVLDFWDNGAPSFKERLECLRIAKEAGFQTSVSIEPMLDDAAGIMRLVEKVEPYVTDSIWIGKMGMACIPNKPENKAAKELLKSYHEPEKIKALVDALIAKYGMKIRIKDKAARLIHVEQSEDNWHGMVG